MPKSTEAMLSFAVTYQLAHPKTQAPGAVRSATHRGTSPEDMIKRFAAVASKGCTMLSYADPTGTVTTLASAKPVGSAAPVPAPVKTAKVAKPKKDGRPTGRKVDPATLGASPIGRSKPVDEKAERGLTAAKQALRNSALRRAGKPVPSDQHAA